MVSVLYAKLHGYLDNQKRFIVKLNANIKHGLRKTGQIKELQNDYRTRSI